MEPLFSIDLHSREIPDSSPIHNYLGMFTMCLLLALVLRYTDGWKRGRLFPVGRESPVGNQSIINYRNKCEVGSSTSVIDEAMEVLRVYLMFIDSRVDLIKEIMTDFLGGSAN